MTDEDAIFGQKKTHNGNPKIDRRPKKTEAKHERSNAVSIEIDGQALTAAEWARHPGCEVGASGIIWRLRRGWAGKDAVFKHSRAAKAREILKAKS